MAATAIPESYASLPFKEITISHVPPSSPTATMVVILAFNRPDKYNAATDTMLGEVETAYDLFDKDDRVRAIVLTGTGKAFCAGADLSIGFGPIKEHAKDEASKRAYRDKGGQAALSIARCTKPTISAINGPAAGVGLTITLPTTIRVACASAKVALPFARRAVVTESCAAFYLPRLIGLSNAMHMTTTGAAYPVSDPIVRGLFSKILPTPEETVRYAVALAGEVAENTSVVSTKLMRDMMVYGPDTPEGAHLLDSRVFLEVVRGGEFEEGVKSFLEKRRPGFGGGGGREGVRGVTGGVWPWWEEGTGEWDGGRRGLGKL